MPDMLFSSCMVTVDYDEFTEDLTVTFHSGGKGTYTYEDVPYDVYASLLTADSAGRYFNLNIRNEYSFK